MTIDPALLAATVLLGTLALFVWGRWRYDLVALIALLAVVILGLVPAEEAFDGSGHPAVVTVAAVLVISRALMVAGVAAVIAAVLAPLAERPSLRLTVMCLLIAVASAFMNNVGALALFLPIALQQAARGQGSASATLMPLSFSSLLGGLITLIGTPPNVIVATYRGAVTGQPFGMFDFAPVGVAVAVAGVIFVVLVGPRVIPERRTGSAGGALDEIADYLTEARVREDAKIIDRPLFELEGISDGTVAVVGLLRGGRRMVAPLRRTRLQAGDVLVLEGDPDGLKKTVDSAGLELAGDAGETMKVLQSEDVTVVEAVITPGSRLEGRSWQGLQIMARLRLNLLAIARQDQRQHARLAAATLRAGDVLLLQGESETMGDNLAALGCLPLAGRDLALTHQRRLLLPVALFGAALGAAATGLLPVAIAFLCVVVALLVARVITLRDAYDSIDWPILILLGALIPVSAALESSGATVIAANALVAAGSSLPGWTMVPVILVITMFLSDIINNAATAVLMSPVAMLVAGQTGSDPDAFLMAVAIGASCAFLTPIGHQNNTLILGPGGYRFSDYWRLGLPLEILIVVVAVPLLTIVFPL